jgi:hypothetical protein
MRKAVPALFASQEFKALWAQIGTNNQRARSEFS